MTSNRPYLIRALYQWILDNAMTPHLVVDASSKGTVVPKQHIENNRIILNIEPVAVRDLVLGNDVITFSARFGGKPQQLTIPIQAVTAIYARENGKGLIFPDGDEETGDVSRDPDRPQVKNSRPDLKIIK